jgi:hypothetical protein
MSEEDPNPVDPRSENPPIELPVPPPVVSPPVPREGEVDYSQAPEAGQYYQPQPQQPGTLDRLIPTRNAKALIAYYLGVFGLVPCFSPLLSPAAIILGILGLKECKRDPNLPGRGHAITGIVLGSIMTFLVVAIVVIALVARGAQ